MSYFSRNLGTWENGEQKNVNTWKKHLLNVITYKKVNIICAGDLVMTGVRASVDTVLVSINHVYIGAALAGLKYCMPLCFLISLFTCDMISYLLLLILSKNDIFSNIAVNASYIMKIENQL